MFGSNDKDQVDNSQPAPMAAHPDDVAMAAPPEDGSALPHPSEIVAPTAPPISDALTASPPESTPERGSYSVVDESHPADEATPASEAPPVDTSQTPAAPAAGDDDLIDIKQQALQSLAPLVNELNQTAEEKFKTTMMLIQASDNSHLIKEAYSAANEIKDEKVRAQALLDVVNEINYFTQHADGAAEQ